MQLSGNKVRKLEFLMADAKDQGADCVITIGGIQSNHCRATAVAAKYLGLDSYLILRTSRVSFSSFPLLHFSAKQFPCTFLYIVQKLILTFCIYFAWLINTGLVSHSSCALILVMRNCTYTFHLLFKYQSFVEAI